MKLLIPILLILTLSGCKAQPVSDEEYFANKYPAVCIRGKVYLMAQTHVRYTVPVYTGETCKDNDK